MAIFFPSPWKGEGDREAVRWGSLRSQRTSTRLTSLADLPLAGGGMEIVEP